MTATTHEHAPANLGRHLIRRAESNPNLEALVDVAAGRRFTYAELNRRADQSAHVLADLGLTPGDRVAVLLPNCHQFAEIFYAAARSGIILVALNWRLVAEELAYILTDSAPTALVSAPEYDDLVAELQARTGDDATPVKQWLRTGGGTDTLQDWDALVDAADDSPVEPVGGGDDPALLMYTSGTTGKPKGVLHSHSTGEWAILTVMPTADLRFQDRYLICLPLFHIGAFNPLMICVYSGATVVLLRTFDPMHIWEVFRDERTTVTLAVPAMLQFMLKTYDPEAHQPLSMRWIMSGASPLPPSLIQEYADLGLEIHQVYGSTETAGPACLISPDEALTRAGSTGKAFFHTEVRIVDGEGNDLGPNEPGEVLVRGRHIMVGYWNNEKATAETVVDGWLHTGDIAIRDEDGFVYIQDRLKDMIISGGENVYPAEIEDVIRTHPKVADVAVIGVPSERWGESPLAVVVPSDPSLTEDEIKKHCDGKLARFKLPAKVELADEIPRNPTGKALKKDLRELYADVRV